MRVDRDKLAEITELRMMAPGIICDHLLARKKRSVTTPYMVLVAADHSARMITRWRDDDMYLCDRARYLDRLWQVLSVPGVTGIEATADVIEDIIALDYLSVADGNRSNMSDKLIIGTNNRGGLQCSIFEFDDRSTGYDVSAAHELGLDGIKVMMRIKVDDPGSGLTVERCADIVNRCNGYGLTVFIEVLFCDHTGVLTGDEAAKAVGVASGLGSTSLNTILEVPMGDGFERAVSASSLPILALPAEDGISDDDIIADYGRGRAYRGRVRGTLLGRDVLFGSSNPAAVAEKICQLYVTNEEE